MNTFLLFLHIVAVGTWLGASVAQLVLAPRFRNADNASRAAFNLGAVDMGTRLHTPAAVVILITGILLVTNSEAFSFSDPFVSLGLVVVIAGAALGMAVFGPKGRQAAEKLLAGDVTGARALESRISVFGGLDVALLLLTIWAMVAKWGAG